ncbi:NUDIX domain-containing protein [bacterium]|nr:NUDIX domain-containing protein [bacterium]
MKPTLSIAVGLIWYQGELAVGKRQPGQVYAGMDEFPGGKCEPNEDPRAAVVREILEETGLHVDVMGLRLKVDWETESRRMELWFFDVVPTGMTSSMVRLDEPFEWWSVERTLEGNFPPANRSVLESIRQRPMPIVEPGS